MGRVAIPIVPLLLSLIAGCAQVGPASAAPLYREAVATFNDPVKAFETDLSGFVGKFSAGGGKGIRLLHRPEMGATGGCLELAWRMGDDAADGDLGGMWLSLRGPLASAHVRLDLSAWDSLSFKVRGRATLVDRPPADPPGYTVRVEVRDDRRSPEHTAYRYVRVEPGEAWSTVSLPADVADGGAWRFASKPLDPRRAKELRFVVEKRLNPPRGRLLLDDIELARRATDQDYGPEDDDDFRGPKVTIAVKTFLRFHAKYKVKPSTRVPQGKISLHLEEMKLPPMGDDLVIKSATVVPMLSSEWQARQDPENRELQSTSDKFLYDGKFVANPKVLGRWNVIAQVAEIAEFDPSEKAKRLHRPLFSIMTFKDGGKTGDPTWVWSGDTLMDLNKYQALKMQVKTVGDAEYLFVESGGFSTRNKPDWKPKWYVLARK